MDFHVNFIFLLLGKNLTYDLSIVIPLFQSEQNKTKHKHNRSGLVLESSQLYQKPNYKVGKEKRTFEVLMSKYFF